MTVEVRYIRNDESPSESADCVVITQSGDFFSANGSVAGKKDATFFIPPPFKTLQAAIDASLAWASIEEVPVVYVKGIEP